MGKFGDAETSMRIGREGAFKDALQMIDELSATDQDEITWRLRRMLEDVWREDNTPCVVCGRKAVHCEGRAGDPVCRECGEADCGE